MSLADKIREIPFDVPPRVVAERIGCKEVYVRVVRQRMKRPAHYAKMSNRNKKASYWRDVERSRQYARDYYQKHRDKLLAWQKEYYWRKKAEAAE